MVSMVWVILIKWFFLSVLENLAVKGIIIDRALSQVCIENTAQNKCHVTNIEPSAISRHSLSAQGVLDYT